MVFFNDRNDTAKLLHKCYIRFVSRSYFNETQFGANASLAVWYGENGSNQEDIQQLLESKISEQAENILFISKDKNMRLIGWKGFGIDQWFPHSTGRFFSEEEEKDGEMVAYIHHDKYDALNRNMKYEGENYPYSRCWFFGSMEYIQSYFERVTTDTFFNG